MTSIIYLEGEVKIKLNIGAAEPLDTRSSRSFVLEGSRSEFLRTDSFQFLLWCLRYAFSEVLIDELHRLKH